MRPFSRRTLLLFSPSSSSPLSLKVSRFSASPLKPREEPSNNVSVSVWWDFENCGVPDGVNVLKLAHNISAAVRANGIKGSIQITAFGDVTKLPRPDQAALSATGINLTHIPQGGKSCSDRSLLIDLLYWVSQNPPPAHLFLISSNVDFASTLHRLRMSNYNILLASREAPFVLCSAATIMWHWQTLVTGQDLAGKHFNPPPDGPYGSWYGHYKAPLDDPFIVTGQPSCSPKEESVDSGSGSGSKTLPVPKKVLKQIRKILKKHPDGISITHLRLMLNKDVDLGKGMYGHKKFSRLLLSMPDILNLELQGSGLYIVRGVTSTKDNEDFDASPFGQKSEDQNVKTREVSGVDKSITNAVDGKKLLSIPDIKAERTSPEEQLCLKDVQEPSQPGEKVVEMVDEQVIDNLSHPVDGQDHSLKLGFLHKIRIWWFGEEIASKEKSDEECSSGDTFEKMEDEEKCVKLGNPDMVKDHPAPSSSINNVSASEKVPATSLEPCRDGSDVKPGYYERIVKWCQIWTTDNKSDIPSEQACSGENELFTKNTFWSDMEAFMDSSRGSIIVSQSMTREELAQNLQKEGPADLSSISEHDLLHLVDMLISEKKWLQQCSSQKPLFKLVRTLENSSSVDHPNDPNNPSSPFTNSSISNLSGKQQPSGRSKSKVLADIQKLTNDILSLHEDGYSISYFRKLFRYRYGYSFNLQELGFDSLESLLHALPGVKVEFSLIFSASNNAQGDNASERVDTSDPPQYDELGPISSTSESKKSGNKQRDADFEPLLSNDDSDGIVACSSKRVDISDPSQYDDELSPVSSTSQSKKSGNKRREADFEPLLSDDDSDSDCSGNGTKHETRKLPIKSFTFVPDPVEAKKDQLIDRIIVNINKSRHSGL